MTTVEEIVEKRQIKLGRVRDKLNQEQAREIRLLVASGIPVTKKNIAEAYGVSTTTVQRVVRGVVWKEDVDV